MSNFLNIPIETTVRAIFVCTLSGVLLGYILGCWFAVRQHFHMIISKDDLQAIARELEDDGSNRLTTEDK